jgi:tetratricopeptide (TPR) repeat protein
MAALSSTYPDDNEAAIFHALSIAIAADPSDKSYADLLKSGAILERLYTSHRDHPGLAHYIIHAYDVPPLADRALEAARQYAGIAPSAPHALHMPSHTFTRTGFWQESIETNIKSAESARRDGSVGEELHASDYQMYAYLQTAQDAAARRLLDGLPQMIGRYNPNVTGGAAPPAAAFFAMAAIPARYALERGAWSDAVALQPRTTDYPYTEAITHFARAVGAAHLGRPEIVRQSLDALGAIRDRLLGAGETYWAEQVEIQRRGASAWLAFAEHRQDGAIADMRIAADREDRTEKSAVTPGPLAPAREMLGELMLDAGQSAAALAEFEATLRKEPNRFRSVAGAARAAAAAGDRQTAVKYYLQLLTICVRADAPGRPELIEARRISGRR